MVQLLQHPDHVACELFDAFTRGGLIYGSGEAYPSLITPSSCILDSGETAAISTDLVSIWQFYRTWNELYRASLAGEEPRWIAGLCEYGLSPEDVQAQRITLAAGLEPRFCRVDYVAIGEMRRIAEVQWKSGGLGLFFGIHNTCAGITPTTSARAGDPVEGLRALIMNCSTGEPVAVNPARPVWLRSEHYLQRTYDQRGVRYIVFDRREGMRRIVERRGAVMVTDGGRLLRIDFFYAQEVLPKLVPSMIVRLAHAAVEGRVWIETPINYVYRQKWGMVLPFIPAYAHLFDNRLRELLGAVILLRPGAIDLTPLADGVPEGIACQLRSVRALDDLARLSTAARRMLVLKCGAGSGAYYSQGRGVLRLNGSQSAAQKTLAFVQSRLAQGEPWIIQRYVDVTYPIEVSPPWAPHELQRINAHARFMVYATRDPTGLPRIIGGLGNFSRDWKVSGRSTRLDAHGRIVGAAFNDMRFTA